jgi:cytochrome c553
MGNARGSLIQRECQCGNMNAGMGRDKQGRKTYRNVCHRCHKYGRAQKGNKCEQCGFIPVDRIQLDVDHKDGNRANNDPDNIWTLCANCHRLKTKRNKDGAYGQPKKD